MDIGGWLTMIQGKQVSIEVIENVERALFQDKAKLTNKQLYERVTSILVELRYQDDAKCTLARYLYEHFLGYHIDPLDLATENFILTEMQKMSHVSNVPRIYMLQKVAEKHNLAMRKTIEFPAEKCKHYDDLLRFYIGM